MDKFEKVCLLEALSDINKEDLGFLVYFKANGSAYTIESQKNDLEYIEKVILESLKVNNIKYNVPIIINKIERIKIFNINIY